MKATVDALVQVALYSAAITGRHTPVSFYIQKSHIL